MPYIDLPPPVRGDFSGAVFTLKIIMLFPNDQESRTFCEDALRARMHEHLFSKGDDIGIEIAHELVSTMGWDKIYSTLSEWSAKMTEKGLHGVTFIPEPSDNGYKLRAAVRSNSLSRFKFESGEKTLQNVLKSGFENFEKKACIAGKTLLNALCLVDVIPKNASLTLAREALALEMSQEEGGSPAYINKAWDQFESVAHLWAGALFLKTHTRESFPCDQSKIGDFLWLSEHFRKKAASFRPKGATESGRLINDAVTWKLPPSTPLVGSAEFQFTTLTTWLEKAIAERRKRRKRQ